MSITPVSGAPAVAATAPVSPSSVNDRLAALKEQEIKLVVQLKATQDDKSLDAKAKQARVAQLTSQKTQLDAQIQRLGNQQASTSPDVAASATPDAGVHVVA